MAICPAEVLNSRKQTIKGDKNMRKSLLQVIVILICFAFPIVANGQSLMEQGNKHVMNKQYKKAAESYRQLLVKQPQNAQARNNLGYTYVQMGQLKSAIEEYEQALSIKPDYQDAKDNLLSTISQYSQDLIDSGKYQTAAELLTDAIKRYPKAGELYYFLGVTYQAQDKFQDAFTNWKKASEINPKSSIASYVKAIEKLLKQDTGGAVTDLKAALSKMPENAYARNMLGILQTRMGNIDEAKKTFETAVKYKPNYVEAYLNLAFIAEKQNDNNSALKYYRTAAMRNPYSIKALMAMGKIYFQQGKFFDAESQYKRALRLQPLSPDLHKALGFTFAKQNKFPQAIKEFETAVNLKPNDAEANYALGLIYKSVNDESYKQKAIAAFQNTVAANHPEYSSLAQQKLGEMNAGGSLASTTPQKFQNSSITAESPDGDISVEINTEWTEVPAGTDGTDKFLWLMAHLQKGLMFTVYRPQEVPTGDLAGVARMAKTQAGAGMNGITETKVTIGGHQGYQYEGKTGDGKIRRVYVTLNNGKAYIITAEAPQAEFMGEIDKLISNTVIK